MERPLPPGTPVRGGGTHSQPAVITAWSEFLARCDALFQLLGVQLDCAGILTRRGLDLRLLLLGQLEADVLLVGHGVLLAGTWLSD